MRGLQLAHRRLLSAPAFGDNSSTSRTRGLRSHNILHPISDEEGGRSKEAREDHLSPLLGIIARTSAISRYIERKFATSRYHERVFAHHRYNALTTVLGR